MSESIPLEGESTPLPVIANVSRIVTKVVDRIAGDRVEVPLFTAAACQEALKRHGISSRVLYGQVAWIEILEDQTPMWAGCWGENFHFWLETAFREIVDLNVSVAHRKQAHGNPGMKSIYSPPMLWSREAPRFYRYQPQGIAELELTDPEDQRKFNLVLKEIEAKCGPDHLQGDPEYPNEPLICPGRKLLDDSRETFKNFDRALGVFGIPEAPF